MIGAAARRAHRGAGLLQIWSVRRMSSLPAHTLLRMPALSPTMTEGVIANWVKKEKVSGACGFQCAGAGWICLLLR